jgi:hypothetical protein
MKREKGKACEEWGEGRGGEGKTKKFPCAYVSEVVAKYPYILRISHYCQRGFVEVVATCQKTMQQRR